MQGMTFLAARYRTKTGGAKVWTDYLDDNARAKAKKLMLKREDFLRIAFEQRNNKTARRFYRRAIERINEELERLQKTRSEELKGDEIYNYIGRPNKRAQSERQRV